MSRQVDLRALERDAQVRAARKASALLEPKKHEKSCSVRGGTTSTCPWPKVCVPDGYDESTEETEPCLP